MREVRKIYLDEDDIIEAIAKAYNVDSTKIDLYYNYYNDLDSGCERVIATFELEEDDK